MLDCYNLPVRITCTDVHTFTLLEPPSLVITMRNQYTASAHSISAIIGVHVQAPELASAAQLSSGGSYGTALRTEDGNGGGGGGRACSLSVVMSDDEVASLEAAGGGARAGG